MRKSKFTILVALMLCGVITLQSCIGSFNLTNRLLSWNKSVGSKFANEVVFFLFWILPVYEISILADVLVLNSIEFWSGSSPLASNSKAIKIKGEKGDDFVVKRTKDGYKITNKTKSATVALNFDESTQTWSANTGAEDIKIMTFIDENNVKMYLPDGQTMDVELSQSGVVAFKDIVENNALLFTAAN